MRLGHLAALLIAAGVPSAATGQHYALVAGSTFQRGCLEPCECPLGQEQPLTGTFALSAKSDNGLFAEYAMSAVSWKVQGAAYATPVNADITGSGSYTVGGEFAIQQQMQADLSIAGAAPEHFDSGRIAGGGGFPDQVDVEISENGKVCFDTVIHVMAKALDCSPGVAYCPEPGGAALLCGAGLVGLLYRRSTNAPGTARR